VRARKPSVMTAKGKTYCRVYFDGKRTAVLLPGELTEASIAARSALVFEVAHRLDTAARAGRLPPGWEPTGRKLLDKAALADTVEGARRIRAILIELEAGRLVLPSEQNKISETTVEGFSNLWRSGELHRRNPEHVPLKKGAKIDGYLFDRYILPEVGPIELKAFTLDDADRVMSKLPKHLGPQSRRHVGQLVVRLFHMAAMPFRLIPLSPIPRGWLPSSKRIKRKALGALYPDEERLLLGNVDIPLAYRLLYGVASREGMRKSELRGLTWDDLDLERGALRLEENKTDVPRAWAMDPSVCAALTRYRKLRPKAGPKTHVFDLVDKNDWGHLATLLRADLLASGVRRGELHASTEKRVRLRFHDLRALFVTTALAEGRTEDWVVMRTGHTTNDMVRRYRRTAKHFQELELGGLAPLHTAIPELAQLAEGADSIGNHLPVKSRIPKRETRKRE
jgi:integrase